MASLFRRRSKKGGFVWHIAYYLEGRHYTRTTGTSDKRLANEILMKVETENIRIAEGLKPADKIKSILLANFIQVYLEYRQKEDKAARTLSTDRYSLLRFLDWAGDCALTTLSEEVARQYRASKLEKVKAASASIELRSLRTAFGWAAHKPGEKYLRFNPFSQKGMIPSVDGKKIPPILSPDEKVRFLGAIDDLDHKRLFQFFLLTACRRSEAVNLQWSDIDLEQKQLTFRRTKTKRDRTIPLSLELLQVVLALDRKKRKPFPFSVDWISHLFKRYLRLAGLREDLHLHCLRHTAASDLVRQGIHLSKVAKLLGHTSTKTTEIYTHVTVSDLREVAEALTCVG
ncbi:MAG: site-specific integrase [bacterium]|nr:site-specific integrase [bacterium]